MTESDRYRLRYLPIEQAQPDMPLGEPIMISERGVVRFRLPVGHVLSAVDIERLQRMHVDYVCIKTLDLRNPEEITQQRNKALEQAKRIFAHADLKQPHIIALFKRILIYRSEA